MRFGTSLLLVSLFGLSDAQLRVATWNVTNYNGGRTSQFQTAIYGSFEGRQMAPDVLVCQEFRNVNAMWEFAMLLNTAPGSPGDWLPGPYIDGNDTDSVIFFRTSKVRLVGATVIATGGGTDNQPRDTIRYDIQPRLEPEAEPKGKGRRVNPDGATIALYSTHMKAGSTSTDQARRLIEAQNIRNNAQILPNDWHFMVLGDFNIQNSNQAAYVELVGEKENNAGRFYDPINTPGNWNNNSNFRFVHTQDPAINGEMDDRLDFILVNDRLIDGDGLDYIGDPSQPYSTTTWDDPNHSYRSWGNDGTSYNTSLTVAGNTMVGPVIAQALVESATVGGHLPVFLDLRMFPTLGEVLPPTFRETTVNVPSSAMVSVRNSGNVRRWGLKGIAPLRYTLSTSGPFSAPAGPFFAPAGSSSNQHRITMDTSTPGVKFGTLTIFSNDPLTPIVNVRLSGTVN